MKRLTILATLATVLIAAVAHADDTAPAAAAAAPAAATPAAPAAADAPIVDTTPAPVGPKLSNFADVVVAGISGENAPEVSLDFATGTAIGSMPLAFEKTKLDDIQAIYGGQIHAQGEGDSAASWLCYTQHARTKADTPKTVWFISTKQTAAQGKALSTLVVENVDAGKVSGCLTAPKAFTFPAFGVPSLGATYADLQARFGALTKDRQKNVYYDSTHALGDGTGQSVYEILGYRMTRKGLVNGIALSQTTN
jgi:hypothetical protein